MNSIIGWLIDWLIEGVLMIHGLFSSYDKPFVLENGFMKALFSPSSGLLEAITDASGVTHQVRLEFKRYETSRSGAYLFWPFGVADMAPHQHGVRLLDGAIYTEIQVVLPRIMRHVVRLFKSSSDLGRSLHVENTHNLMMEHNIEPVMRLSTDIKNNLEFHTDSNGFQMVPRRTGLDLPMQANYFPATTMAFLQVRDAENPSIFSSIDRLIDWLINWLLI